MKTFEAFLTEKGITKEQFAGKSGEEMAELHNEFQAENRKAIDAAIEAKASKEDILALKEELIQHHNDFANENMTVLKEAVKQMGLQMNKLTEAEKAERTDAGDTALKGLTEHLDTLKLMKEGSNDKVSFKVATITSANISGGNVPVEQRTPGFDIIPSRRIRLLHMVDRGVATSNLISWVSQAAKDGSAGQTGEGLVKNQIDFDIVVNDENLKKTTAFIKVSEEMLDDVEFISSEINSELTREVMKKLETQVYSGDGTGLNHNGIRTTASAIDVTGFSGTVDNANVVDVLRVAMTNIENREHEPATFIMLNAIDVTKLLLVKVTTTDKRYIDALQVVAGQLMLDGVPIVKTTLITSGEYIVGNFSLAKVWDKGSISIEVGREGTDFIDNVVTILAEVRALTIVKTNVQDAFVKGVIATDAALLETP